MKVVNVEFVENEMVEMDVAQIGSNWGWGEVDGGDESEFGGDECGDACGEGHAEKIFPAAILPNPLNPSPHPLPNQSKPTVQSFSFSSPISFPHLQSLFPHLL